MPQNHKKFHSVDGKRQILVVDDELINRNILGEILKTEYDVLYAEDGLQALQMIRENRDTLSLVLLDILMPGMSGIEVLQEVKKDKEIAQIPIIVITSEQ
ncbi:MAG: response regulator, partial [Erysipelotrichaceae bacterium]|nr:response regulator [Erysipelotrichaceae bacterium]